MQEVPLLDWVLQAIGTIGSVTGIVLAEKKKKVCWLIWIVTNCFWIWLYHRNGWWVAIGSMALYQFFNAKSWFAWRKDENLRRSSS